MKKLLTFVVLLSAIAFASNDPPVLVIHGPDYVAASSYGVDYHMGIGGHLNGNPVGRLWWVIDENGVQQDDWIVSGGTSIDAKINILSDCTIYARFHYREWGTNLDKYIYDSYEVRTGTPTFTVEDAGSIHNGQYDTTITGITTRVIHFNIDRDEEGDLSDSYKPDYQINGEKHLSQDDDILPLFISHSPSRMNVKYIKLVVESPHIRLCRINPGLPNVCIPITTTGSSTVYCGDGNNLGRIFDRNLYLEGMRIRVGNLKIKYVLDNGYSTTIADLRYRTCADIAGRQEMAIDNSSTFPYAQSLSLTGCEFSLYDTYNITNTPPFLTDSNDYNAPALAVDYFWDVLRTPFKVKVDECGTPGNPFVYSNSCWYTSYEAFGGSVAFYESSLWEPKLFNGVSLNNARVINYEDLSTAIRSSYEPGICPGWKMFYMKLTGLYGWYSDAVLHHRGEVLYQYYYDLHSSSSQSNWLPKKYGLQLE